MVLFPLRPQPDPPDLSCIMLHAAIVLGNNHVEYVLRDGLVKLSDEHGLNGGPLRVAAHVRAVHGAADMLDEVVLAEDEVEVGLPRVVRRAGAVETDRDPGLNIEVTDGSGGGLGTSGLSVRTLRVKC